MKNFVHFSSLCVGYVSIKNGGYVGCAPVMVKRDTSLMLVRRVVKAELGGLSVI